MANAEELRKKRNKELLERMKDPNDNLTNGVTKQNILFPIRPVIKKDKKEIDRVLNNEP